MNNLADKDFRHIFNHPDIIHCEDCTYKTSTNLCSNIYSYPPIDNIGGCKNGILLKEKSKFKPEEKVSLWQKIKCFFGFHRKYWLGKSSPYPNQILMRCPCCGKYGLYDMRVQCTDWFKREDMEKHLTKECIEMIKKYSL